MARRIFALILLLLTVLFTGCSVQHWIYEDLSFTLPADFENRSAESYAADFDFLYDDGTVAISGIRETRRALSAYFGDLSGEEYARLVIALNGIESEPVQKSGLWCFTYEAVSGGTPMSYLCAIYEAEESFWQVQAYCASADFADREASMWELISSMKTD